MTLKNIIFPLLILGVSTSALAIKLGLFVHDYQYLEPEFMQINGLAEGVEISHKFQITPLINIEPKLSKTLAKVDYRAHSGGAAVYDVENNINEIEVKINKSYSTSGATLIPSIGIGHYDLEDLQHSTGTQNQFSSAYDRLQKYQYYTMGLISEKQLKPMWKAQVGYEHRHLKRGEILSKLSQTAQGGLFSFDVLCKQSSGSGSNTFASVIFNNEVGITLFRKMWDIKDSDSCFPYAFVEPANTTTLNGLKITYQF